MTRFTTIECDCCLDKKLETLVHQVKVSFDHGSLSRASNQSKTLDLCDDCLQFVTGETVLHGGAPKLAKALAYLVFGFVIDGLKAEAARGREGESDQQKPDGSGGGT